MSCLIKITKELIDTKKYELASKTLHIVNEYGDTVNDVMGLFKNLAAEGYNINQLCTEGMLVKDYTPTDPLPPIKENKVYPPNKPELIVNNLCSEVKDPAATEECVIPSPDKEYILQDFKKPIPTKKEGLRAKLNIEDEMVILTVGWSKKDMSTAGIIKHSRRISSYFGLYDDPRWMETYNTGKVKMRAAISGCVVKLRKLGILFDSYKSGGFFHYGLTDVGNHLVTEIAGEVDFSLYKAF